MKEIYEEQVTLCGIRSLIASNIPTQLPLKEELGQNMKDQSSFGFWNDPPAFNTYYPEAKEEDFTAKDSEFIQPLFRMLSNTVVISGRGLIEFPVDVLKKSMGLMVGQSIYPNHDMQVGNELGAVVDNVWQESYKVGDKTIPAGINARLKIDAKSHPNIARGLNMTPPSIHSVSCTVVYRWKPSRSFEKEWEFYEKMGTYDENGQLIRKIATEIVYYMELSLVPHGADPFAKKLDENGKIVLPNFAEKQSVKVDQTNFAYNVDWRNLKSVLNEETNSFNGLFRINNNQNNQKVMTPEEIINLASQALGLSGMTTENFKTTLDAFKANMDKLVDPASLKLGDVTGWDKIQESFNAMTTELTELRALKEKAEFIQIGEDHLKELREEAINLYKMTLEEGKTEDEAIVALINKADAKEAKSMLAQYQAQLEKEAPLTCKSCGGHDISRSSFKSNSNDDEKEAKEVRSFESIKEELIYRRDFKGEKK
jgi:hypothetical protein